MKRKILLFIFTLILVLTGIASINAYDKYDGDYTLEYLLRNYNVVTFGTKERYNYSIFDNIDKTKGSVTNVFDIGGPVLIRGNYTGSTNLKWDNEFAQKTNCIPSYIKGKIGDKIKAGSIESAELSNIYVGSSNKVTNNDGYYTVNNDTYKYKYPVKVSDDYLDFDKLYASVVNEQKSIEEGSKLNLDGFSRFVINKSGFYTIDNVDSALSININNYDTNKLYVITINSESIYSLPNVLLDSRFKTTNKDIVYYGRTEDSLNYSGNIIWNFPNARYVYVNMYGLGHIIAPKADVELAESHYPGAIIANSISSPSNKYTAIQFYPYSLDEKIVSSEGKTLVKEEAEINTNDLYNGNYSIDELLKNYSVVTLGTKAYGSNTKLSTLTDTQGTASIFHIVGQFLINGDLGLNTRDYEPGNYSKFSGVRLDFMHTEMYSNSYFKGKLQTRAYQPNISKYVTSQNLYAGKENSIEYLIYGGNLVRSSYYTHSLGFGGLANFPRVFYQDKNLYVDHFIYNSDNYIDFKTLYDAIVEQQKRIDDGVKLTKDDNNNVHVKIGGNYVIDNVSDLDQIIFTNYSDNKDKLTVITIKDKGEINLPVVGYGSDDSSWAVRVYTNDWHGKTNKTYDNESLFEENYYGNIVFNIPNATKITLAEKAPFIGHIIAPNTDVETPELHFAGAMIVNSLYTEGNTEAHFYPLTVGSVGTGINKETKTIGGEVEKITISGTKTWDDNNNQDGLRPESVTINLLANGEKVDSVTITEKDDWKYSFSVPRVDENGIKINYTITEDAIEHYATKIESFSNDTCPSGCKVSIDGYNITNSYTPKKTSLTVNKVWKDENNVDKLRPDSVEVELYANGKRVGSATLNEENNWTYIFNEIDMNENGQKIEYTVKEKEKIKGYTTSISGDQETGYTITNTHVVKKVNPTTGDNIKKFLSISIMSLILLGGCIVIFTKYRNKKA